MTDGILLVDKLEGPTSHDMVDRVRRALGTRRVGHTGTLDPFASGLLLLCVGRATRLAEYVLALPKTYRAVVRLGEQTDTDDRTGQVLARSDAWRTMTEEQVRAALQRQRGTFAQLPPLYSAKKIGGERAYVRARRGEAVERRPVRVTIERIELLAFRPPDVEIELTCSSGTYVRAVARDLGEDLGVGGHLHALRRTRIGPWSVEGALRDTDLDDPSKVRTALLPPVFAVAHLPQLRLTDEVAARVRQGLDVPAPPDIERGAVALLDRTGALLGVGTADGRVVRPRKILA